MKNFILVLFAFLFSVQNVFAQCTPNPAYANAPGFHFPDSLTFLNQSYATAGMSYSEVIDIKTIRDTSFVVELVPGNQVPVNLIFDAFRILSIQGAPSGFSFVGGGPTYETADPTSFGDSPDATWWNTYGVPNNPSTIAPVQGCLQISANSTSVATAAPSSGFIDYPLIIRLDARIADAGNLSFVISAGSWLSELEQSGLGVTPIIIDDYVIRVFAQGQVSICTPDQQYANEEFGFYPNSSSFLANEYATEGSAYSSSLTLKTISDSSVFVQPISTEVDISFDAMRVESITGLPTGFTYAEGGGSWNGVQWNNLGSGANTTPVLGCLSFAASSSSVSAAAPISGYIDYPLSISLDARISDSGPLNSVIAPGSWLTQFSQSSFGIEPILINDYVLRVYASGCAPTTSLVNVSQCSSYNWNGTTYTQSGTYTYTTTNSQGCDSIATLNLTITPLTSVTNVSACGDYTWNNVTYSQSGTYTYTTTGTGGCDSIATLNLTQGSVVSLNESQTLCGVDTVSINGVIYTSEGQFTQQWAGIAGCDTVLTININAVANPNLTILGSAAISPNSSESYAIPQQPGYSISWSAVNGTVIDGQGTTSATIFWDQNGSGQVIVEISNSTCSFQYVLNTGPTSVADAINSGFKVLPNPSNGQFTLRFNKPVGLAEILVLDNIGRKVFNETININGAVEYQLDLEGLDSGVYPMVLITPNGRYSQKLLVQ